MNQAQLKLATKAGCDAPIPQTLTCFLRSSDVPFHAHIHALKIFSYLTSQPFILYLLIYVSNWSGNPSPLGNRHSTFPKGLPSAASSIKYRRNKALSSGARVRPTSSLPQDVSHWHCSCPLVTASPSRRTPSPAAHLLPS